MDARLDAPKGGDQNQPSGFRRSNEPRDPLQTAIHAFFTGFFLNAGPLLLVKCQAQIPIYRGDQCTALLTSNTVARWLGSSLAVGMVDLEEASIEDVLVHREEQELFRFLPREATVFEALQHFERETKQGKSLIALLITQNGKSSEKLLGMMALWDLPLAHALVSLSRK